jgi:hypothetical protein
MAITSLAAYNSRRDYPHRRIRISKNSVTTVAGRSYSSWLAGGYPAAGTAPTTAAIPTRTTTGALNIDLPSTSGTQRLLRAVLEYGSVAGGGMLTICDRLAHSGGLSGTVTGSVTTNLPTPALTRNTGGIGNLFGWEIYTAVGTTGTVNTGTYKDTAGATHTAPAVTFGGTAFREASRIIISPLAVGDFGVTTVESANLTASTLTAGAYGATIFFPLVTIPMDHMMATPDDNDALFGFGPWFPIVDDNACLMFIYHQFTTSTGVVGGEFHLALD